MGDLWLQNPVIWNKNLENLNGYFQTLCKGFSTTLKGTNTLEATHDSVRHMLFNKDNITFHLQSQGTNIDRVVTELMHTPFAVSTERINCTNCGILTKPGDLGYHIMILSNRGDNTATAIQSYQKQHKVRCPHCMQSVYSTTYYNDAPKVIMTELSVLGSRQYLPSKTSMVMVVLLL